MSLSLPRLPAAWNWGGLSFKEVAVRTYEAVDKHETLDRASQVKHFLHQTRADVRVTLGGHHKHRLNVRLEPAIHQRHL